MTEKELDKELERLRPLYKSDAEKASNDVLENKFKSFRSLQQEALLYYFMEDDAKPLVGILPTNSGKSLIYQAGAKYIDKKYGGKTVVISPLISLMIDQVTKSEKDIEKLLIEQLKNGIICFNSSVRQYEKYWYKAEKLFETGKFSLLYVSPERFRSKFFLQSYKKQNIMRFVIDEMHCVELWGQSFRYEYKNLKNVIYKAKLVLLTASAGKKLIDDTLASIIDNDKSPVTIIKGDIVRKEINILPAKEVDSDEDRLKKIKLQVKKWISKFNQKDKILIFTAFANEGNNCNCVCICDYLQKAAKEIGVNENEIAIYNGTMNSEDRTAVQSKFANSKVRILVCTKAFGMGVDIKNIRGVLHVYPPVTIEEYYQEIGRGGRSAKTEKECETLLLWRNSDDKMLNFLKRTPWAFRLYYKYILLSTGVLLVEEYYDTEKEEVSCSIKTQKAMQFIEELNCRDGRNKPKYYTKADIINKKYRKVFRYDMSNLKTTERIIRKIEDYIDTKNPKGDTRKDLNRIARWLMLYYEQRKNTTGIFKIQGNTVKANSIKSDLSLMEEQGWILRASADSKGSIAKYRVLENDLDNEQVEQFFMSIHSLGEKRDEAWKKVQKMLKYSSSDEIWIYLKKNL
ncbi:hypothetical protein AGMMS49546_04590 [Spirochaetia bacterium]|nr:hypothetical protein AGMMS49546_04590 [Spirochaetia bacterium]